MGQWEGNGAYYVADPGMNLSGMSDQLYVVASVTNVGRRRMRWKGWGGEYLKPLNGKSSFLVSAALSAVTLHSNPEMMLVCYQSLSGN